MEANTPGETPPPPPSLPPTAPVVGHAGSCLYVTDNDIKRALKEKLPRGNGRLAAVQAVNMLDRAQAVAQCTEQGLMCTSCMGQPLRRGRAAHTAHARDSLSKLYVATFKTPVPDGWTAQQVAVALHEHGVELDSAGMQLLAGGVRNSTLKLYLHTVIIDAPVQVMLEHYVVFFSELVLRGSLLANWLAMTLVRCSRLVIAPMPPESVPMLDALFLDGSQRNNPALKRLFRCLRSTDDPAGEADGGFPGMEHLSDSEAADVLAAFGGAVEALAFLEPDSEGLLSGKALTQVLNEVTTMFLGNVKANVITHLQARLEQYISVRHPCLSKWTRLLFGGNIAQATEITAEAREELRLWRTWMGVLTDDAAPWSAKPLEWSSRALALHAWLWVQQVPRDEGASVDAAPLLSEEEAGASGGYGALVQLLEASADMSDGVAALARAAALASRHMYRALPTAVRSAAASTRDVRQQPNTEGVRTQQRQTKGTWALLPCSITPRRHHAFVDAVIMEGLCPDLAKDALTARAGLPVHERPAEVAVTLGEMVQLNRDGIIERFREKRRRRRKRTRSDRRKLRGGAKGRKTHVRGRGSVPQDLQAVRSFWTDGVACSLSLELLKDPSRFPPNRKRKRSDPPPAPWQSPAGLQRAHLGADEVAVVAVDLGRAKPHTAAVMRLPLDQSGWLGIAQDTGAMRAKASRSQTAMLTRRELRHGMWLPAQERWERERDAANPAYKVARDALSETGGAGMTPERLLAYVAVLRQHYPVLKEELMAGPAALERAKWRMRIYRGKRSLLDAKLRRVLEQRDEEGRLLQVNYVQGSAGFGPTGKGETAVPTTSMAAEVRRVISRHRLPVQVHHPMPEQYTTVSCYACGSKTRPARLADGSPSARLRECMCCGRVATAEAAAGSAGDGRGRTTSGAQQQAPQQQQPVPAEAVTAAVACIDAAARAWDVRRTVRRASALAHRATAVADARARDARYGAGAGAGPPGTAEEQLTSSLREVKEAGQAIEMVESACVQALSVVEQAYTAIAAAQPHMHAAADQGPARFPRPNREGGGKVRNRDVNAARNMLMVFLCQVTGQPRPSWLQPPDDPITGSTRSKRQRTPPG